MKINKLWFYYRHGQAYYIAQLIQAINLIILVYFVAGDKVFFIRDAFPHIAYFVLFAVGVGVPLIMAIGYLHYKKAYKSEADILTKQNPYNTKIAIPVQLALIRFIKKNTTNYSDFKELEELESYIAHISKGGKLDEDWRSDTGKERSGQPTQNTKAVIPTNEGA